MSDKIKLGKDNVIMGSVLSDLEMGDGNVVIGTTDSHGNTIINTPMAVGRDAQACPDSIAIGVGAKAGSAMTLGQAIQELMRIAEAEQDRESVDILAQIATELRKTTPDKSVILRAWIGVKAAASISGAYSLFQVITKFLAGI
jgi:hypothetical protein